MEKIYFIHNFDKQCSKLSDNQCYNTENYPNYFTIAYRQINDKTIEYGYAVCNKNDRYNKQIGREVALKYLNEKNKHYRIVHLEDVLKNMDTELHLWLFSILDFYNYDFVTFNNFHRWRINRIITEDYERYVNNKPACKMHLKEFNPNSRIGKIFVLHTFDNTSQPRRKFLKSLPKEDVLRTRQRNYTIAYRFIDKDRIEYAVAICHPDDTFEKKIGRSVARKYLNDSSKRRIGNITDFINEDSDDILEKSIGFIYNNLAIAANMYRYKFLASIIRQYVEVMYDD